MRKLAYYALLLIFLSVGLSEQSGFPDLTGTWRVNLEKSQLPGTPPEELIYTIRFDGDALIMVQTETRAGAQPRTVELKFDKTGKESVNRIGETEMRTVLRVEGKEILEESTFITGGEKMLRKSRQRLSDDGRTLTMAGDYSGDRGNFSLRIVLDKQ